MDNYENYDLFDIEKLTDNKEKYNILIKRNIQLEQLAINRIARKIINEYYSYSIYDIIELIEKNEMEIRSQLIFPDDLVYVYPKFKQYKAKKTLICDISGAVIPIGSDYCYYSALIENISRNEKYVLKRPIKVELGYEYILPDNIHDFEILDFNLRNAYNFNSDDNQVDYYNMSLRVGEGLILQKVKGR